MDSNSLTAVLLRPFRPTCLRELLSFLLGQEAMRVHPIPISSDGGFKGTEAITVTSTSSSSYTATLPLERTASTRKYCLPCASMRVVPSFQGFSRSVLHVKLLTSTPM